MLQFELSDDCRLRLLEEADAEELTGFTLAIVCHRALAGVIGLEPIDSAHRTASIGYWLGVGQQGRGTTTRAVQALVEHAVSVLELSRIEIRAAVGNARSRAILQRLGFREEDAPPGGARRRRLPRLSSSGRGTRAISR